MRIDVWLDIRCPNCYIAKRKFQMALEKFEHRDKTNINWRSFELSPTITPQPGKSVYDYLAELKFRSREWSVQMHEQVAAGAKDVGLTYNFDSAIIFNSFNGHRLIQFAKTKKMASQTIDKLYYGYFTEGKDLNELSVLEEIGISAGLPPGEVHDVLHSDKFAAEVRADEQAAEKIVRGVPFFLYNNSRTISGAHTAEAFLVQMREGWEQYQRLLMDPPVAGEDDSCSIYGFC